MVSDPAYRKMTAEEFLQIDFGPDKKCELVDGVIYAMTGGTRAHARVQANLMRFLGAQLRGSGCRPYGPDMGVRIDTFTTRYPDLVVTCNEPQDAVRDKDLVLDEPKVIVEVLSPTTKETDQGQKLAEYQGLPSVDTILLVDSDAETVRIVQRLGPSSWRDDLFGTAVDIPLPSLAVTIPAAEIFARD